MGQEYQNLEVLIVNDGATDVKAVLSSLNDTHLNARLIEERPGQGRARAANIGLRNATGHFIAFLDDDDWILPSHIRLLSEALMSTTHYHAAYSGVQCIKATETGFDNGRIFSSPFDRVRLQYENYIPIHALLFRRQLLEHGCAFDNTLDVYEDWDFWLQLSLLTDFLHIDQITAYYRVDDQSGFGVTGDAERMERGVNSIMEKWRHLWPTPVLRALLARAREADTIPGLRSELEGAQLELHNFRATLAIRDQERLDHQQHNNKERWPTRACITVLMRRMVSGVERLTGRALKK
jgi:glycosyltransferase involved in cell wall biosynthesis